MREVILIRPSIVTAMLFEVQLAATWAHLSAGVSGTFVFVVAMAHRPCSS